jgi:hypothetical protein
MIPAQLAKVITNQIQATFWRTKPIECVTLANTIATESFRTHMPGE